MDGGTRDYDVAILGAGLVGLSLAASLADDGMRVAIADRSPLETLDVAVKSDDWDARVYAVSPGSVAFLSGIGAWQRLREDRLSAIESMEVRGDAGGKLTFSAYELGQRALAWIVESRELHAALVACLREAPGIDVLAPRTPSCIGWSATAAELRFDGDEALSARLIVGADGVRSWTREQAAMHHQPRPYAQIAVVANFASEQAHRGRAFQWFLADGGVLAWLPLPGRRISMVWSAPTALAEELAALDRGVLAERVALAGGRALGALTTIGSPLSFPLSLLRLPSVIAPRLALVGDAAHGVHPLAGQGVNLGFGDAAVLSSIVAARGAIRDPGASLLLQRYASRRLEPVFAMQGVTDGLVRLFGSRSPWLGALRNRGMTLVGSFGPLKRLLAQPALR
ncbi:MAG: FAD-dependent monooxygenase [Pseudomonadota bacterium]|nr:FAD-dependent monooxygenase [Pseudomonadota bacterium]